MYLQAPFPVAHQETLRAAHDVVHERARQTLQEGFSLEHDDQHKDGQLAQAAAAFALIGPKSSFVPAIWPADWSMSWLKPWGGYRRTLIKAGALILAEIERVDREFQRRQPPFLRVKFEKAPRNVMEETDEEECR